jgi:hypothetical protein
MGFSHRIFEAKLEARLRRDWREWRYSHWRVKPGFPTGLHLLQLFKLFEGLDRADRSFFEQARAAIEDAGIRLQFSLVRTSATGYGLDDGARDSGGT